MKWILSIIWLVISFNFAAGFWDDSERSRLYKALQHREDIVKKAIENGKVIVAWNVDLGTNAHLDNYVILTNKFDTGNNSTVSHGFIYMN